MCELSIRVILSIPIYVPFITCL